MWLGLFVVLLSAALRAAPTQAAQFTQPDAAALPNVYQWTDTVNVWVIRDGESAVLIDLGDGSVLEHLGEIGVKRVEWVLFTNHHREHCQGASRLARAGNLSMLKINVGAPAAERNLFEKPTDYRKMQVRLGDPYTIHGASYVRPPVAPILVERAFEKMDTFEWHGHTFWCIDTKGSSPGAMSYLVKFGDRWTAFSGDVMLEGSKLNNWFDSEWDYGFAAGIWALSNSAAQVAGYDPLWLLPSHGPAIREPQAQLTEFRKRLHKFEKLYLRGYSVLAFSGSSQDPLSRPTKVPHVWQVSPHVYKFRGPDYYPNFYLIIADSGRALAIDCGLIKPEVLDRAIVGMREHLGLKSIDAMIPTHMHGDHFLQGPHLRAKYGTQLWALDRMAEVCAHPERFDYAAPIQAYGQKIDDRPIDGVKFDRLFKDGEVLKWEGYEFTIDWMPGQTEFALGVQGVVDGKRIVFTGDNIFGDPTDPTQSGHECVVAHNSSIFEEGYILGSEYLSRSKPDLLLGGHSYVMPEPKDFIERYRKWSYAMRDSFKELIREEEYKYGYDPFWVRAQPYRSTVEAGGEPIELTVHVRNFLKRAEPRRIEMHASPGLVVEPKVWEGTLEPESRGTFKIKVSAAADAAPGVKLVAFDVTRDGQRYGELFDAIIEVKPTDATAAKVTSVVAAAAERKQQPATFGISGRVSSKGVPRFDPDYAGEVRSWWAAHPLNPKSTLPVHEIASPEPIIELKSGDAIDEAIAKLPEAGGTVKLTAGKYGPFKIIGRSNVHLLGPATGEAIITGHSYIAVCEEAMDYVKYDQAVSKFDKHPLKDRRLWEIYKQPTGNFLLRNITFDGEGKTVVDFPGVGIQGPGGALGLKRVRDVLVDKCTFRNFVDAPSNLQHCGLAWGHYGLTNVWFRDCEFLGTAKYAVYLDGAHGSGLIHCKIDGKGCKDGGLLFLANHDFTDDLNENDKLDADEEKCAKFVVVDGCTFDWSRGAPIRYTGRELLVQNNTFNGLMAEAVGVYPTGELAHRNWSAGHLAIRIVDNKIGTAARAVLTIFDLNPTKVDEVRAAPVEAQYTVEGNEVTKTPAAVVYVPLRK